MSHALAARSAERGRDATGYQRHRPERTLLYRIVEQHYPAFVAHPAAQGTNLPDNVRREFEEYLRCGRLERGFMRVRCDECHHEHLVASSCKRRGFCPSCGARRMAERAALMVEAVFPEQPVRQWVLSFPYPLHFLFAHRCEILGEVLGIVYRVLGKLKAPDEVQDQTLAERRASMTWAQRLKRVFGIDIETCQRCGGAVRVIACIEDPAVIRKILDHLKARDAVREPVLLPESRAPESRASCVPNDPVVL